MSAVATIMDPLMILREYVRSLEDGVTVDYVTIEQESGVTMSAKSGGRQLLRRALRFEKRDFEVLRDRGIRLSSAENAPDFAKRDVLSIAKKSKVAQKRVVRLLDKHGEQMADRSKKEMIAIGSFHGAVAVATSTTFATRKLQGDRPPAPVLPFSKN